MEIKQRKREEIEEKYKWDLSSMYKSSDDIEKDYLSAETLTKRLEEYENKELDAENLYNLITLDLKLNRILDKLIVYANLKVSEDSTNSNNQKLYTKASNFLQNIYSRVSFVNNKILKLDYELVKKYIEENKELEEYKLLLEIIFKDKKHMLSDEEEKLLANLSKSTILSHDAYSMLTSSDINFGQIKDEDGNIVELTDSNYYLFIKSKDRNVRRNAFEKFYGTYGKYKNTISTLYESHLQTNNVITKLRKYNSMLDAELDSDNLDRNIYDNLISVVNNNLSLLHKYYELKKQMLKLDEFHIYDVSAPIFKKDERKYSFEDAKKIIIDTYSKWMNEYYISILNKAFDERWIDVYNNEGKSSGAFSSGIYDSNPYILTNYEEKMEDISTLSHELGHSVNTYLSKENNPYQYYDYPLFLAEIASLTNEIIFNVTCIKEEKDLNIKLYLINNLLKVFISNFFDATLYAEFEKDVHEKIEDNESLTSEYFCDLCYELNRKYYGDSVIVDDEIKYRWEMYDHLYTDFYLYKYATGIACATYCASKILNKEEGFLDKYIEFLKVGTSKYPKEALLVIGIDITKENFMHSAIDFYSELLNEFQNTYDSIK